jgi:hypothetical protein
MLVFRYVTFVVVLKYSSQVSATWVKLICILLIIISFMFVFPK